MLKFENRTTHETTFYDIVTNLLPNVVPFLKFVINFSCKLLNKAKFGTLSFCNFKMSIWNHIHVWYHIFVYRDNCDNVVPEVTLKTFTEGNIRILILA